MSTYLHDQGVYTNNGGFPTSVVAALISNVFGVPFSKIHKDIKRIVDKASVLNGPESPEFKEEESRRGGQITYHLELNELTKLLLGPGFSKPACTRALPAINLRFRRIPGRS
jgi:hypothetical protein